MKQSDNSPSRNRLEYKKDIQQMELRWGSCTINGNIILNPELIKASVACIEYVITHELCHLVLQTPQQSILCIPKPRNARLGEMEKEVGSVYGLILKCK